jgi:hypothetical protein
MPNIDNAAQFLTLAGNTSSTNGQVILASNAVLTGGNSYNIGNNSIVANGYCLMNGSLYMNFGVANANSTGTLVTLGHPYVTGLLSAGGDSNTVASTVAITAANTTTITLTSNTTTNVAVYWQTWGI